MSTRADLATALRTALRPKRWDVIGYPRDQVRRKTAALFQTEVEKEDQLVDDGLRLTFALWILVAEQDPNRADDALDAALLEAVEALRALDYIHWEKAERRVLDEIKAHGYLITLTAVGRISATT